MFQLILVEMSGDLSWADKAEWLYYNGAHGMMHPEDSSIMYCKTDNCYSADEHRCPEDGVYNPRYKYSPTHQDAAVCCVPNSGRIVPYFIASMFLKTEQGFQAVLYGSCILKDTWQEAEVTIKEHTEYPFALHTRFEVTVSRPIEFSFAFRFPDWADQLIIDNQTYDKKDVKDGQIVIRRLWEGTAVVGINMVCAVQFKKDFNGDVFISRGPLVYALPIPAKETIVKELKIQGFCEKTYVPMSRELEMASIKEQELLNFQYKENPQGKHWEVGIICGKCRINGVDRMVSLVPMGHTILRKVTFSLI